jgi:hypothetical protein
MQQPSWRSKSILRFQPWSAESIHSPSVCGFLAPLLKVFAFTESRCLERHLFQRFYRIFLFMGDPSSENGNEVYEHRDFGCCRHRRPRGSLFVENTQLPKVAPNSALDKTRTNTTDFARVEASKRQIAIVDGEKILKTARCMVSAVGIELRPLPCEENCQSNRTANFIAIQRLNPIANQPFVLPYRGHAKGQFRGLSSEK